MTEQQQAEEILNLLSDEIQRVEEEAFESTVSQRAADGWANPILQAQSEWQGHDNQVQMGTFTEALRRLREHGENPGSSTPTEEDPAEGEEEEWLATELSTSGKIGTGKPLAYCGVDGYFTLICEGASEEEIRAVAADCLSSDDCEEGEWE